MGQEKTVCRGLERAKTRLEGMRRIDPKLDLGGELSVKTVAAKVEVFEAKLAKYNALISQVNVLSNEIDSGDAELEELATRALAAVKGRYGEDSGEYEGMGAVRKSERKKPVRAKKETTPK